MSKVSIILPTYNVEDFIITCIDSIINQTYPDWELIVVDDASKDNTYRLLQSFKKDKRIQLYRKEHGGLSAARNYGLKRAKGEFVYFMDSDDWIDADLIEDNLNYVEEKELDFTVFGYYHDSMNKWEQLQQSRIVAPRNLIIRRGTKKLYLDGDHLDLLGYAWNKLYRKSFLDAHDLHFEEGTSLIEDILFNTEVFSLSSKISFRSSAYYHYMNRPRKSLVKSFYPNSFYLVKRKIRAITRWLHQWKIEESSAFLSYAVFSGLRYCLYNLFESGDKLSFYHKKELMSRMVLDPMVVRAADYLIPDSRNMEMLKTLVLQKDTELAFEILSRYYTPKETLIS